MAHTIEVKIYYEDTDAGGVVYYANYLRYLERARTEFLRESGIDIYEYHRAGTFFVVAHMDIRYRRPARLGDTLDVTTEIAGMKNASLAMRHEISRGGTLLVEAHLTVVHVDGESRPRRLPEGFKEKLGFANHA